MSRFFRLLAATFICLMSFNAQAYLQSLSPQNFNALYALASRGDVSAINNARSRGLNIDSVNGDGDTGLCVAAKLRNRTAFRSFIQSGANPSHPCTWNISGYQSFMQSAIQTPAGNIDTARTAAYGSKPASASASGSGGSWFSKSATGGMSWTTKALIGAGVVAAGTGIALAVGGGGGGGGGNDTDPNCVHGEWHGGVCQCYTGYRGEKCDECDAGYVPFGSKCYQELECVHGRQNKNKCVCNRGYAGDLCDVCAKGFGKDSSGLCVVKKHENVIGNGTINSNYNEDVDLTVTNTDYTDVYGLFYDSDKTPHDYILESDKFANNFVKIESTTAQTTVPDYVYDDDDNIVWFDSSYNVMGYIDGSLAYDNTDEVIGHVVDDVVYSNGGERLGEAYKLGSKTEEEDYLVLKRNSSITVSNNSDGAVYGMYSQNAESMYNLYLTTEGSGILVSNIDTGDAGYDYAYLNVTNQGDGDVYGMSGGKNIYTGDFETSTVDENSPMARLLSYVTVTNQGNGNAYGMYSISEEGKLYNQTKKENKVYLESFVSVENTEGKGNTYGMYSFGSIENSGQLTSIADAGDAYGLYTKGGTITNVKDMSETSLVYSVVARSVTGNAYGAYVEDGTIENGRVMSVETLSGTGNAYGIYATKSKDGTLTVNNTSGLFVTSAGGDAYGIYNKGGDVKNSTQRYEINVTSTSGKAYGIYTDGGTVENSGYIYVNGPSKATTYGIYATNGAEITNKGTFQFRINNIELNWQDADQYCTSSGCRTPDGGYAIYLTGGAKFVNEGRVLSTSSLNLSTSGTRIATGGSFEAASISGDLEVDSRVVSSGFEETYTLSNAINTPDATGLRLSSESVLFDAKLDGKDIVLTKKDFSKIAGNESLGAFLEANYANGNNEKLFADLKTKSSLAQMNNALSALSGEDIFSRFSNEDLLIAKELDFQVGEKMFDLKDNQFSLSGEVNPKIAGADERSRVKYALSGTKIGGMHLGVGLAIADMHSDDGHNGNAKDSKNFMVFAPMKWQKNGFDAVVTPKAGYVYGTYERDGYLNKNYEGKIEKRMLGVNSEVRYPVLFGSFKVAPVAEAGLAAYDTKIKENAEAYSLSSDHSRSYSATFGLGAYVSKEKEFSKKQKLSLTAGASVYHEFLDPYDLKLKMNNMNGQFRISDEKRRDDYVVLRSKLSYDAGDFSIYGNLLSYIDSEHRTQADIGFKYAF